MKPGRMLILLISITPASTSAAPPICHQVSGSSSSQTPKKIVRMGPSVPISAVLEAPMRRMAAEVMNTGNTVENTAMPSACR